MMDVQVDRTNQASNYGSTSSEDVDIDQDIEQSNSGCEGACSKHTGSNVAVVTGEVEPTGGYNEEGEYETYDGNDENDEDEDPL